MTFPNINLKEINTPIYLDETVSDDINTKLKVAFKFAEDKDFDNAKKQVVATLNYLWTVEDCITTECYKRLKLSIDRMDGEVKELESVGDDWFKSWYASSAGGSTIRDIKAGRNKVIDLTDKV